MDVRPSGLSREQLLLLLLLLLLLPPPLLHAVFDCQPLLQP